MKIMAGDTEFHATTLIGEPITYNGQLVYSIKMLVDCDVTQKHIDALANNPWDIYDDNDVLQSTQERMNIAYQHSITFLQLPNAHSEIEALKSALAAKEAELQAALALLGTTQP